MTKPMRCIDPVMKYCQGCRYGNISYPCDVETYSDTQGSCFDYYCMYGLEKDEPTEEELNEFYKYLKTSRPKEKNNDRY